jgi:hypothetical protein
MNATQKIEVLKRLAGQRDEVLAELLRAFPHGRPTGYARGYDDRNRTYRELDAQCEAVAQEIYALLAE